tara:strand:+ start:3248 stop:4333 length:1086 start_codon:yes stop_codon:yes gene_type:complete
MKNKLLKTSLIRTLFLFSFIIFADLLISSVTIKRNLLFPSLSKFGIPRQVCSLKTIYDASSIYDKKESYLITYERDENCYRSKEKNNNKKIVLTIGGSTTDQRFINEGETFQDLLDIYFEGKYDFINGGVDGQSSIGHLFSIQNWHSKALNKFNNKVSDIIFYIGVNDQRLPTLNKKKIFEKTRFTRIIRDYLANNSYTYSQIKNVYFTKAFPKTFNIMAVHGKKFIPIDKPKKGKVSINNLSINGYKYLINDLLKETKKSFPNSKIHIIQQQVPGCKFKNPIDFLDRHSKVHKEVCKNIGQVYLSINYAVGESKYGQYATIYPMYLQSPIDDDGFYDFIHTNKKGSRQIAEYIFRELNFN